VFSTAYRPRPPRNVRALAATLAATVLISGLVVWANSTNCLELVIASSKEKYEFLATIAATYDPPRVDRVCVTVNVIERASGTAENALKHDWANDRGPRPHVWSPASTTWLLLLSQHRKDLGLPELVPPVAQSLIQSPLVIAMPEPMATTLQTSAKRIGWHDVLTLAQDPEGWARFGKPWGPFLLGKTTPLISTSGLHALINLNYAAQAEADPTSFLRGVESSVPHYADSVGSFVANLRRADDEGRALEYVSAIAVEEKQVYDYNRGNTDSDYCPTCKFTPPKVKLVALYPKEGTLVADHPYAVLNWTDDAHRQAAFDFERHLESASVQSLFQQEGFRDHRRQAGNVLQRPYFDPDEPTTLYSPPTRTALVEMVDEWSATIRKRANALILLDVGPSLDSQVSELGTSKLVATRRAITDALELLADDDDIGLWTFPTADGRPFQEVLPMTRRGPPPFELSSRLKNVATVSSGRTLYRAIGAALDRVQVAFAEGRVNAIIVVSDGINGTSERLDELIRAFQGGRNKRVLIFTVALSAVVKGDLERIAAESRGLFYDASDPTKISDAIRNALANL
jgi:Ca-activated chloride channel family protein